MVNTEGREDSRSDGFRMDTSISLEGLPFPVETDSSQ